MLSGAVALGTAYARPWRRAHLRLLVAERLQQRHCIETRYGALVFVSAHARALEAPRNFHSAEPGTLAWIDSFAPGAVLWDIGANVGVYSLYAGRRGDIVVLAFEPAPDSYAALCTNLAENRLDHVRAYCLALAEHTRLGTLTMPRSYPGSVFNALEQDVDLFGRPLVAERRQTALGIAADDLVDIFGAPAPNHVKLDVDSTEVAILRGAQRILRSPELLSVSVENARADTPQNLAIATLLGPAGFRPDEQGPGGGDLTINVIYRRQRGFTAG